MLRLKEEQALGESRDPQEKRRLSHQHVQEAEDARKLGSERKSKFRMPKETNNGKRAGLPRHSKPRPAEFTGWDGLSCQQHSVAPTEQLNSSRSGIFHR